MTPACTVILDGHAHLYPSYPLPAALNALFANLGSCAPSAGDPVRIGILADTALCRAYRDRIAQPRPRQVGRFVLQPTDEAGATGVRDESRLLGYLIAGRQIVTAEKIEVLALTIDPDLPDGLPARDTLAAVRDAGGLPALCWSPGKWSGSRGTLVRALIDSASPADFLLGDTTLRPQSWAEPVLLAHARSRGFRVIWGTDPLPFAGEEARLGTYATLFSGRWDAARPLTSLRQLLAAPDSSPASAGRRLSISGFALRWTRMMLRKYLPLNPKP